jgi:hypothetical protein
VQPAPAAFPDRIEVEPDVVRFEGPMDMGAWSLGAHPAAWAATGDLLPWGEPYVTFRVAPDPEVASRLEDQPAAPDVPSADPERRVPPMPRPHLRPMTAPSPGRSVDFAFYDWLDVPLVADRWHQYEANDYARVEHRLPPVRYRTTPYFSGGEVARPFETIASGLRLRVTGRHLPEISMATIGGGDRGAGFVPFDLLGGLGDEMPADAHATFDGSLRYGTREREAIYRQEQFWGYYGWENFLDARIVLDDAGARAVLGIGERDVARFGAWWRAHETEVELAWKRWLMAEFVRLKPMPFFNFPLEIWHLDLERRPSADGGIILDLTILDEALDLVYSRWLLETVMPAYEPSIDDMHLHLRVGPEQGGLVLDTATDWSLSGEDMADGATRWTFEPSMGDNPVLANEYRATASPALPYLGKVFRPGTPSAFRYTSTPTAFDLQDGERLSFHWHDFGLRLQRVEPAPAAFPDRVVRRRGSITFVGPLDLTAWSRERYASDWAALGGPLPRGVPIVTLEQRAG